MSLHNIPLPEESTAGYHRPQWWSDVNAGFSRWAGCSRACSVNTDYQFGDARFLNLYEGVSQAHETNSLKIAIFAGLLVLSGAEDLPQHRLLTVVGRAVSC